MRIGKAPITVKWIDINMGDAQAPNYRPRLVAREVNTYKRDDLFAATPPLEALKMIISMIATANKGDLIMVNDISRAFFHAKVTRDVYVQLPKEDKQQGEEETCGKLRFSMYGTRDAAQNWHNEYTQQLVDVGFQQGLASPCIFYYPEKEIRSYVHGEGLCEHWGCGGINVDASQVGKQIPSENPATWPRARTTIEDIQPDYNLAQPPWYHV